MLYGIGVGDADTGVGDVGGGDGVRERRGKCVLHIVFVDEMGNIVSTRMHVLAKHVATLVLKT